nr:hypothetical protein [uncultured Mucilaginibacter sp.]
MIFTKTICYIYEVFFKSNIRYHLKAKLKAGLLVAALLASFFCISGYVSQSASVSAPAKSGQAAAGRASIKAAMHYKGALRSFQQIASAKAYFAKQNNSPQQLFTTRFVLLSAQFSALKQTLAYPVRHLSLAADNS